MKVIWITGASSGIGEALALQYAEQNVKLILSARNQENLEKVKRSCIAKGAKADNLLVLPLDISQTDSLHKKVALALEHFEHIDLLINNAGVSQRSFCVDTDIEVYKRLFDINVLGQIALTKAVLPSMLARSSGQIAVTSSVAGKIGVKWRTGYCAAKHAVLGFFDALRAEVAEKNINVSTIVPGFIKTDVAKNALGGDGHAAQLHDPDVENGMDVNVCATKIIDGLNKNKNEIVVAEGLPLLGLYIKRWLPSLAFKIAAKKG